jgi:hypothetical protein
MMAEDELRIVPDVHAALEELPALSDVEDDATFRGWCVDVNDHGNIMLLMKYKNGNRREIWSVV